MLRYWMTAPALMIATQAVAQTPAIKQPPASPYSLPLSGKLTNAKVVGVAAHGEGNPFMNYRIVPDVPGAQPELFFTGGIGFDDRSAIFLAIVLTHAAQMTAAGCQARVNITYRAEGNRRVITDVMVPNVIC